MERPAWQARDPHHAGAIHPGTRQGDRLQDRQFSDIVPIRDVGICHNHITTLLAKIVDKDGKIPTGKQVSDVQEALRVAYFNAMTGDNAPEPFSSEDEAGKADRAEAVSTARANKLDKFHPMELYLYFHFGPASVGGCDSPYFLETAAAIQEAVKVADLVNREQLRKRNADDVEQ